MVFSGKLEPRKYGIAGSAMESDLEIDFFYLCRGCVSFNAENLVRILLRSSERSGRMYGTLLRVSTFPES
jgi:hypothetical protein